jgi:hypothetical protein
VGIGTLFGRMFGGKKKADVGGTPVEIVQRQFIRTATDTTLLLQQTLREASLGPDRWTVGRVWLASAAYAFFIYAWWNQRNNDEDKEFLAALNRALFAVADDIVQQEGGDREEIVGVVRTAFQEIQAAFGRMDPGDLQSCEAFSLRVQQILMWIALTDASDIQKALDRHSAQQLSALMSETFASLGASNDRHA